MAEFSLNDMEQAKRRVQDMQQRAKSLAGAAPAPAAERPAKSPPVPDRKPENIEEKLLCEKPKKTEKHEMPVTFSPGIFGGDRALILLLLLLLRGEKCDNLLLLALLYCAM